METYIEIIKLGMGDYSLHHLVWHLTIVALCIIVSGIFSIADTISGIYTAKKVGEKLRSHRFRKTIEKMAVYWFFQILVAMVGLVLSVLPWYNLPYLSIVFALLVCFVESCSMWEHSKRRKDQTVKIPEAMQELIDFLGGEEELKKFACKKLGMEGGVPGE